MLNFLTTKTPLHYMVQSFWRDEAFTYILGKQPILTLLQKTAADFNPPLYYLLVHFWMQLFGHSEVSLRLISLLFFWGILYVAYLFMTRVFEWSPKKSFLYLLFFLYNPHLLYYAFEARMYTMLAFFAMFSCYAFFRKQKKTYLLVSTLGLFTHYFMIWIFVVQFVYLLFFDRKLIKKENWIIIMGLCGVIFFPWLVYTVMQKWGTFSNSFWIMPTVLSDFYKLPGILYTGYERDYNFLNTGLAAYLLPALSFLIVGLTLGYATVKTKPIDNQRVIFFALWAFLPSLLAFFISQFKPIFLLRYLIFTTPGLLLFIVYQLDKLPLRTRIVAIVCFAILTQWYQSLQLVNRTKSNVAETAAVIKKLIKPTEPVLVESELDYQLYQYYIDDKRVFIYNKPYNEIPDYVGKVLIPPSAVVNRLPVYPARAFVIKPDGSLVIESAY